MPNTFFQYLFRKMYLQDSYAKNSHFTKYMRPHYNSQFFLCFILVLLQNTLDVQKYASILCHHSDLYFSFSSVKFQVVSGLELQVFDTMKNCEHIQSSFVKISSKHRLSQTVRARDLTCHVLCYMVHVTCDISHVSLKKKYIYMNIFYKLFLRS